MVILDILDHQEKMVVMERRERKEKKAFKVLMEHQDTMEYQVARAFL